MTPKEFSRGLKKLAMDHKDDEVNVFETSLFRVFMEAAEMIQDLDMQLKDAQDKLSEVQDWFDTYAKMQTVQVENEEKGIDIPIKEPTPVEFVWDGVRRDEPMSNSDNVEEEKEEE